MVSNQDKLAEFVLNWGKIMVTCWTDDRFRTELLKADPERTREMLREMGYELPALVQVTVRTSVPEEVFRNPDQQPKTTENWKLATVKVELTLPPPPPIGMRAMAVLEYLKAEGDERYFFTCC